ncbi:MAG: COG1470 family protein, partial [Promethearchaeota archaeon]
DHLGVIGDPVVNTSSYEIYLPFDTTFELKFVDVNNTLDLDGATATFDLDGTFISLDSQANGIYSWLISNDLIQVGTYDVIITLGIDDYVNQTFTITLSVMIVETEGALGSILQPGYANSLPFDSASGSYLAFSPFNVTITYNITDTISNGLISEFLLANLTMESGYSFEGIYESGYFVFEIPAAQLSVGLVNITISFEKYGYENITVDLVLDVFEEYTVIISTIEVPTEVLQGDTFSLVLRLTYNNGTDDIPLVGEIVSLTTDHADLHEITNVTDSDGYVLFEFILPTGDYTSLNITIEYNGQKYGIDSGNKGYSVQVNKTPEIPMWLVYLILGFVGFVAMVVTIQKKVIAPRRMHFTDMVMSSATIFEDAINIQHVMIIFKSWGTSIFFKSFADDTIDPDLISGFLSAVQSFGKELKSQSALNELSYGDKILQFMDGEYIRVTLVLGKSASPYLKRNLSKFVSIFEVEFKETLEKWRGQLNVFQGTEDLIDEVLKTSVILPHQFNPDIKKPKDISRALTKQLLSTAKSLIAEDRPFLFLAQILQQAIDETGKAAPEIILSITELLDRKILIPVKIEQIAEEEITEAQKGEIHARVWKIPNKTNAEKEELYTQLLDLSEAEREVTLSSLLQTITITSEYTKEEYEVPKFTKSKEAKAEMNSLVSQARKTLKGKEFDQSLKYFEFAEIIAIQWNFKDKAKAIEGNILATTVEKYRYNLKMARKAGRKFEKSKDYEHATEEYQKALDSAHRLYQLGLEDAEDDIKTLTHKVIENKQECAVELSNEDCINSDVLIKSRKKLIQTYSKKNKSMDRDEKIEALTRIAVISNLLFKFGASSEIKFVKTYQKKIEDLKKSLKKESDEIQAQNAAAIATSQEMSSMLDKMRKEAELDQNWFNAIILYQKRLNIEYKLGNIDRGVYLAGQIQAKISKVPYIYDLIDETREKIKSAKEQSNSAELQQNEDLLKILKQMIFNFD